MTTTNGFEQIPRHRSIGDAIRLFMAEMSDGRSEATERRYSALGVELLLFADAAADRFLTDAEQMLVHGARELGESNPVWRLVDAESLAWALPGYLRQCLDDPAPNPGRQRARATFVNRLLTWLLRQGLLDPQEHCCMVLELRAQVRRLRAQAAGHPSARRSA